MALLLSLSLLLPYHSVIAMMAQPASKGSLLTMSLVPSQNSLSPDRTQPMIMEQAPVKHKQAWS